jgi:membrane-bound acyltransferase YfiQ involved in biofilm formation
MEALFHLVRPLLNVTGLLHIRLGLQALRAFSRHLAVVWIAPLAALLALPLFTWLSLAYSLWEGFMGVAMALTLLVWCRDHLSRQGRLLRVTSADSYAVYVLHPLLIVPLALALSGIRLDLSLKFVLVAPVAVALCFLVGCVVRKLPVVRGVL